MNSMAVTDNVVNPVNLERFGDLGVDQVILPLFARDVEKLRRRADALAVQTLG